MLTLEQYKSKEPEWLAIEDKYMILILLNDIPEFTIGYKQKPIWETNSFSALIQYLNPTIPENVQVQIQQFILLKKLSGKWSSCFIMFTKDWSKWDMVYTGPKN